MIDPLRPGDGVALVAPSSPFEVEQYRRASSLLETRGYRLIPGTNIFEARGYLAGVEAGRAEDLIRSITSPDISAIICIRGGFGSSRLLPWLPFSALRNSPKLFLGYSDATFLHLAFWNKMGWTTFHGPNLIDMIEVPERMDLVLSALSGELDFSWRLEGRQLLRPGTATGTLLGGNLTCLCHLLGTPYFPNLEGSLLLLEDRGEALYRLDRMVTQLRLAGVFDQIRGLLLGQFLDCGDPENVTEMMLDQARHYSFPIIADLPFGHGPTNQVVPLGTPFTINTFQGTLKVTKGPFTAGEPRDGTGLDR